MADHHDMADGDIWEFISKHGACFDIGDKKLYQAIKKYTRSRDIDLNGNPNNSLSFLLDRTSTEPENGESKGAILLDHRSREDEDKDKERSPKASNDDDFVILEGTDSDYEDSGKDAQEDSIEDTQETMEMEEMEEEEIIDDDDYDDADDDNDDFVTEERKRKHKNLQKTKGETKKLKRLRKSSSPNSNSSSASKSRKSASPTEQANKITPFLKTSSERDLSSVGRNYGNKSSNIISLLDDDDDEDGGKYSEIEITVSENTCNKDCTIKLMKNALTIDQVKNRCMEELELYTVSECDLEVWIESEDRWRTLLSPCNLQDKSKVKVTVKDYYVMDDVKVENISRRDKIHIRFPEFDEDTLNKLETAFDSGRKIAGDGNCFYRCAIFGALESMIANQRDKNIKLLEIIDDDSIDDSSDVKDTEKSEGGCLTPFFNKLTSLPELNESEKNVLKGLENKLENLLLYTEENPRNMLKEFRKICNDDKSDSVLVKAGRNVVAEYLKSTHIMQLNDSIKKEEEKKEEEVLNPPELVRQESENISLADIIQATFDGLSVEKFIEDVVLFDGRDAENVMVAYASESFQCKIFVWQLDKNKKERLTCLAGKEFYEESSKKRNSCCNGEVHMLLWGGHYNLMYPLRDFKNEMSNYENIIELLSKDLPIDDIEKEDNTVLKDEIELMIPKEKSSSFSSFSSSSSSYFSSSVKSDKRMKEEVDRKPPPTRKYGSSSSSNMNFISHSRNNVEKQSSKIDICIGERVPPKTLRDLDQFMQNEEENSD